VVSIIFLLNSRNWYFLYFNFQKKGGNTIQFAKMGNYVISIEIDSNKIQCSQHNSKIYGVERNIEFINGDYSTFSFFKNAVDVVLLAPPWGKSLFFLKK
jgi:trimethylguanosine synthase